MIFVTSDSHFDHCNIIRYCNRPFKNVTDMNDTIIRNWNRVVRPEDTVYHLGDFALTGTSRYKYFLDKLNGTIILVTGNHDKSVKRMKELGFSDVYKTMVLYEGKILTHVPVYVKGMVCINVSVDNWQFSPIPMPKVRNVVLSGHVHNNWLLSGQTHKGDKYRF